MLLTRFQGTSVCVGRGVSVGEIGVGGMDVGIGVFVGIDIRVGGTGVEAGAHTLNKTVRNTNARKTDPIDFFMTLSPFDFIIQRSAQRFALTAAGRVWIMFEM